MKKRCKYVFELREELNQFSKWNNVRFGNDRGAEGKCGNAGKMVNKKEFNSWQGGANEEKIRKTV